MPTSPTSRRSSSRSPVSTRGDASCRCSRAATRVTASRGRSTLTSIASAPDTMCRMTRPHLATLTGLAFMVLTCGVAAAYPPDHGPFVPGHEPTRVPLLTCPMLEERGPSVVMGRQVRVYGEKGRPGSRLRAIAADFYEGIEVEVVDADGRSLAAPRRVSDFPPH